MAVLDLCNAIRSSGMKTSYAVGVNKLLDAREQGFKISPDEWASAPGVVNRLAKWRSYKVHTGCVNTIVWSDCGRYILSGSDDRTLAVVDTWKPEQSDAVIARIESGHRGNVFSARFMPGTNLQQIVSCAGDGTIALNDVPDICNHGTMMLNCHTGTVYEVCTIPGDSNTFISCGEDCCVRWFDKRDKTSCEACKEDVIVECRVGTCAVNVNPMKPFELVVGCVDSVARIYDLRKVIKPAYDATGLVGLCSYCVLPESRISEAGRHRRITSVDYSHDGRQLCVSFSSDDVYIYSAHSYTTKEERVNMSKLEEYGKKPPKRIRLRGDWSDTGPEARPINEPSAPNTATESEPTADEPVGSNHNDSHPVGVDLLQRFSGVLSRMFETAVERREHAEDGTAGSPETPSSPPAAESGTSTATTTETVPTSDKVHSTDDSVASTRPPVNLADQPSTSKSTFEPSSTAQSTSTSDEKDDSRNNGNKDETTEKKSSGTGMKLSDRLRQFKRKHLKPNEKDTDDDSTAKPIDEASFREKTKKLWRAVVQSVPQNQCITSYQGHRNARTTLKQACFWGVNHVISGSDCGHIFVWDRTTHKILLALPGDTHVVNCVQPHPAFPILATSGIQYDIKLWTPLAETPFDDPVYIQKLVERNNKMLEETRDTVTIPAMYMLRMLAQMDRRQRRRNESSTGASGRGDDETTPSTDPPPHT